MVTSTLERLDHHWVKRLTHLGLTPGSVIGAGIEGTVVEVGPDLVAKIWRTRPVAELRALEAFYDQLAQDGFSLATPSVLRIEGLHHHLHGAHQWATIERRLGGRPLETAPRDAQPVVSDEQASALGDVLAALAALSGDALHGVRRLGGLPILPGEPAFIGADFVWELAGLVVRRSRASREPLLAAVPDLDALVDVVVDDLRRLDPVEPALVHGDLIPANVLVDEQLRPTAVLDFGFFSTVGDPAFDAAVAASVYDMYGIHARASEARLDAAFADRFGHDPRRVAIYRAAYALTTSTCFSASGDDGHFEWCAAQLQRADLRAAIGM